MQFCSFVATMPSYLELNPTKSSKNPNLATWKHEHPHSVLYPTRNEAHTSKLYNQTSPKNNKERAAKPGNNGLKWLKMGEIGWQFKCATSSIHRKRKKNLLWDNRLVKKGHN